MSNHFLEAPKATSEPIFGYIFTPTSECILQMIFYFHQKLSKIGILQLQQKIIFLIQNVFMAIFVAQKRLR